MHDEGPLARSRKRRQGTELLCEAVFRPLAHLVVLALLPLRAAPPLVVVAGAATGVSAAVEIARGDLLIAALLLQLKTVLDNADGQLARLSGRVTAFGRYLDSECDFLVNATLFAALGPTLGWLQALAGFLVLTFVLGVNFNADRLYRQSRGADSIAMPEAMGAAAFLARVYAIVYAPQDMLAERFAAWRIRKLGADASVYHDAATVGILANFGLSTQLAAFGACLAFDRPDVYIWLLAGCLVVAIAVVVRRDLRARKAVRIHSRVEELV